MAQSGRYLLIRQSPADPCCYQMVEVTSPGNVEIAETVFECRSAERFLSALAFKARCADPDFSDIVFSRSIDNVPFGLV